ncbi:hypothetical protein LJ656_02875 [Paraburkholderia sp. MMS20-SJTR3]|uniref:Uncharacterized protein n=1 Tax=Paraburkholderia sejongensis TaxID=2886946 RepID=A0ABS8JNR1_9BURK|nr:hypothetical protein [Paraburkholderia sp. MMS20-SJTR3]MCC8391518.1 hypothetical protein [Paraburkholderia sp. MMS20-SJTR3]
MMTHGAKPGRLAHKHQYRSIYRLELARGSSYIASTLSPESLRSAIAEVLDEFSRQYGQDKLPVFRELLAENLEDRANGNAAHAVRNFARPE